MGNIFQFIVLQIIVTKNSSVLNKNLQRKRLTFLFCHNLFLQKGNNASYKIPHLRRRIDIKSLTPLISTSVSYLRFLRQRYDDVWIWIDNNNKKDLNEYISKWLCSETCKCQHCSIKLPHYKINTPRRIVNKEYCFIDWYCFISWSNLL